MDSSEKSLSSVEIVDPMGEDIHPWRRFLVQIAVPFLGVVCVVLTIIGISLHSYHSTREGVLHLSHALLDAQRQRVAKEVVDFLNPASKSAYIIEDMLKHSPLRYENGLFDIYTTSMLRNVPQIQSFYLGDEQGHFAMVDRTADGLVERTRLKMDPVTHQEVFYHLFYDKNGVLVKQTQEPSNNYDPRVRPWYKNAGENGYMKWYKPYYLHYLNQVLIASAASFTGADGKKRVFSVNITLSQLTTFLASLQFGQHGIAAIVDKDGTIIADKHLLNLVQSDVAKNKNWDPATAKLDPKTSPIMSRAYDNYRVNSYGVRNLQVNDKSYIMIAAELPAETQGWVLLVVVPESDFADFAVSDGKQNFLFSLVIVGLAVILASLLVSQARRTDKVKRRLRFQQQINAQQGQILGELAYHPELLNPSETAFKLTEALVRLTGARKVSLWRLLGDGATLLCDDSYDDMEKTHSGGFEIAQTEVPEFFAMIASGENTEIDMASADKRTSQFYRLYMQHTGTTHLSVFSVLGELGAPIGAILLEDATLAQRVRHSVEIIAGIVAFRFELAERQMHNMPLSTESAPSIGFEQAEQSIFNNRTSGHLLDVPSVGKPRSILPHISSSERKIFSSVAIMMVSFLELGRLTTRDTETIVHTVKQLSERIEEITRKEGISYVQIVGNRIFAATGCVPEGDPTALQRMAMASLSTREACVNIMGQIDMEPSFKIGLAWGPAYGDFLGKEEQIFNIWGNTVRNAELMAYDAPEQGIIQVTENVYEQLRNSFLFRPRGTFFMPEGGIAQTFVMAGKR